MEEIKLGCQLIRKRLGLEHVNIAFCRSGEGFDVLPAEQGVSIRYGTKRDAFRALTFVDEVVRTGTAVSQKACFRTLCYMVDVSRNAVLNMSAIQDLMVDLAMMGYDSMMLYLEDTYEVPEYEYFGHMRGRYSQQQLRQINDFGLELGIEVIPCIQTLAHLSTLLRWSCFADIADTPDILLADCDKTYQLLDRMFHSLTQCFSTKRIHIGMDEAIRVGLGRYLHLHGYQNRFSILTAHLKRVKALCDQYGLRPMMWSDMYFRLYNHGEYCMSQGELPQHILDEIPEGVDFVYWDYYTDDVQTLDCMFQNHAKFKGNTVFAGGAWKWSGFAPFIRASNDRANIHIDACVRNHCSDVIVTGWADDGAEASQFCILPTLALYAERCFDPSLYADGSAAHDTRFAQRFEATFGIPLAAFAKLDLPNEIYDEPVHGVSYPCPSKFALYNGVLGGLLDAHIPDGANRCYAAHAAELEQYENHPRFGYLFRTLSALCRFLALKAELSKQLRSAYANGDRAALAQYQSQIIPDAIARLDDFLTALRRQWHCENKPFGFEVQALRLGGLKETLNCAALRLDSYLNGADGVLELEELACPMLPIQTEANGSPKKQLSYKMWNRCVTACTL